MTGTPGQPAATPRAAWDALSRGRPREAAAIATRGLKLAPTDPELRASLGAALVRLGDPAAALPHLEAAANAGGPRTLNALANTYKMLGRPDEALAAAKRTLDADPDSPTARCIQASVLRTTGRAPEALEIIAPLAASKPRSAAIACEHADCLRALARHDDALDALAPHASRNDLSPAHARAVHIRRAQIFDELDRTDDAFAAAARANADARTPSVTHAAPVIERWTRAAIDAIPVSTARGVTPVLVVGMPRSGTTLLERIISAHPSAAGVGECPSLPAIADEFSRRAAPADQTWPDTAGARYLAALDRPGAPTHAVDKMPANVFNLGLAERVAPTARVIHATRDPRDVCLSCYFQELNASMGFTRDLAACARQHLEIDRVMHHWHQTLTLPWCQASYEDLVADPEPTVRRVLEFLGLAFDPACLAFHKSARHVETASWAQVTRPLYTTSVGKWRRYEKHMAPALAILGEGEDGPA